MEALQLLGDQITTTVVATGMAATTCRQCGGSGVAGTVGGAADARPAREGDVSKLQIARGVGWKLFGAGFDDLWLAER